MNKTVDVVARFDKSGKIIPKSFEWRGVKHTILSLGRQWVQDGNWHFLVMASAEEVYELVYQSEEMRWHILRTPQDFGGRSTFV